VYLLPNLITSTGLMLGFWSITLSIRGEFEKAALAIVLAMICDMLDGRVARATHSSSRFGVEFDSLSDLTAFGIAPALLMCNWTLLPLGPRGWLVAGLFALCAALPGALQRARDRRGAEALQGIATTFAAAWSRRRSGSWGLGLLAAVRRPLDGDHDLLRAARAAHGEHDPVPGHQGGEDRGGGAPTDAGADPADARGRVPTTR
jgi:hypothetical protein